MASIGLQPPPEAGPSRSPRRSLTPSPLPNIIPLVAAVSPSGPTQSMDPVGGGDVEMAGNGVTTKEDSVTLPVLLLQTTEGGADTRQTDSRDVGITSSSPHPPIPLDPALPVADTGPLAPSAQPSDIPESSAGLAPVALPPTTTMPLASSDPNVRFDPVQALLDASAPAEAGPSQSKPSSPIAPTSATPSKPKRKRPAPSRAADPAVAPPPDNARPDAPHYMGSNNDKIRCICGIDEDDGLTIQCEGCFAWQHASCFGWDDAGEAPDEYYCELCAPGVYKVDRAAARARQLEAQHRRAMEARYSDMYARGLVTEEVPVQQVLPVPAPTGAKRGPKPKRPRTGSGVEEVETREKEVRDTKEKEASPGTSTMGPPKARRKPGAKPRAKPVTAESTPAPTLPPAPVPEVEDDYFRIEPWTLEYTPIAENVIRGRDAKRIISALHREWMDTEPGKRTTAGPSGLPSPTETGATRSSPDMFTSSDFSILAPPIPVTLDSMDEVLTSVRVVSEVNSFLPLNYAEVVPLAGPYNAPAVYAVHVDEPVHEGSLIGEFRGEVVDCETYRRDPINQYNSLGLPKPYVRPVGPPVNLILDARGYGSDMRFVRSGCHPNAVLRPILHAGKVRFGVFATTDLAKDAEVVLGWEWDDEHVVHTLRSHICPSILASNEPGRPAFAPATSFSAPPTADTLSALVQKFDTVLTCLMGTFTSCACPISGNCALAQMKSLVELEANAHEPNAVGAAGGVGGLLRNAAGRRGQRADMGPLVGAVRGWRRREIEMAKVRAWHDPGITTMRLGVSVWGKKPMSAFNSPAVRVMELDERVEGSPDGPSATRKVSGGASARDEDNEEGTAKSSPTKAVTRPDDQAKVGTSDVDMEEEQEEIEERGERRSRSRSASRSASSSARSDDVGEDTDDERGGGADVEMDNADEEDILHPSGSQRGHRASSQLTDPEASPSPPRNRNANAKRRSVSSPSPSRTHSPTPSKQSRRMSTRSTASPSKRPNGIAALHKVEEDEEDDFSDATSATEARTHFTDEDMESDEPSEDDRVPDRRSQVQTQRKERLPDESDSSMSGSDSGSAGTDSGSGSGSASESGSDSDVSSPGRSPQRYATGKAPNSARRGPSPADRKGSSKPTSASSSGTGTGSNQIAPKLGAGKSGVKPAVEKKSRTGSPASVPAPAGGAGKGKTSAAASKAGAEKDKKALVKPARGRRILSSPVSEDEDGYGSATPPRGVKKGTINAESPSKGKQSAKPASASALTPSPKTRLKVLRRRSSSLSSAGLSPPPPSTQEKQEKAQREVKPEGKSASVQDASVPAPQPAVNKLEQNDGEDIDMDRVPTPPLPEAGAGDAQADGDVSMKSDERVPTPPLPAADTGAGPQAEPVIKEVTPPPPKEKTPPPPEPAKIVSITDYLKNYKIRKVATTPAAHTANAAVNGSDAPNQGPDTVKSEADFIASVTAPSDVPPTRPPFTYTASSASSVTTPGPGKGGFDMSSFLPSSYSTPGITPSNGLQLSTPTPGGALTNSSFVPRTEYFPPQQPQQQQPVINGEMPAPAPTQKPTSSSFQPRASTSYAPRQSIEAESVTPPVSMPTPSTGTVPLGHGSAPGQTSSYVPRSTSGSNLAAAANGPNGTTPTFLTPALHTTNLPESDGYGNYKPRANSHSSFSQPAQSPGANSFYGDRNQAYRRPSLPFNQSPEHMDRKLTGSGYSSDTREVESDRESHQQQYPRDWEQEREDRDRIPVPSSTGSTTSALPPALAFRDAPPHSTPSNVPPPNRNNFNSNPPSAPRASLSPVDRTTNLPRVPPTGPKVPPSGPRGAWSATLEAAGADSARGDMDGQLGNGGMNGANAGGLPGANGGQGQGMGRPVPVPLAGMRGGFRGGWRARGTGFRPRAHW